MRYKEANTSTIRGTRVNSTGPVKKEGVARQLESVETSSFVVQHLVLDYGVHIDDAIGVADVADQVCRPAGGSLRPLRRALRVHLTDIQSVKALWKIQGIYQARA